MSENESSSKKERMAYDSGRDRLSELPLCIIHIILSSLPLRDAIRTSILSRQFRYTWISMPHLLFDLSEFRSKECMEKFVTNVLKLHKGPIHKFEMSEYRWPIVDEWLLFLPRNEICELTIRLGLKEYFLDRHQLCYIAYSCSKLTRLELYKCRVGPPPSTFTGFLFLRCLILLDVYISLNDVESFVAYSPLLEMLKLERCGYDDQKPELSISAPNLKYLDLETYPGDCMQIYLCAPLLAEMSISIYNYEPFSYLKENRSTYNYASFFAGCNSLQKLRGNFFNKVMSYGIDSCQYSFMLPHLKVIELNMVNISDVKEMSVVARLVTGAPNLQNLRLSIQREEEEVEAQNVSYMDILHALNFKCEKLKTITMGYITGLSSQIEFLKFVLESSPVLEIMNLCTAGLTFKEDEKLRAELLNCNLASPDVMLWLC